ncbi:septum formation initiator family protein [Clostridium sp. BJN0001]|uniref:FtsB family cell division protein n=1 Tax=Clostridium sp. BJN0001 TaxID=2930219 RepID=UPI001FCF9A03|nr:septum formation initiator family protein [Clostridium sp. BJN0001]
MKKKLTLKKLIILVLIVVFAIAYIRQYIVMKNIESEIVDKEHQISELNQKNERLQDEVNEIDKDSTEYLEKLARERLGMIKPGEKVISSDADNADK